MAFLASVGLFADRLAAVASAVRGYQLPHYRRSGGPGGVGASIRKSPCFPDRDCRCRETSLLACSCLTLPCRSCFSRGRNTHVCRVRRSSMSRFSRLASTRGQILALKCQNNSPSLALPGHCGTAARVSKFAPDAPQTSLASRARENLGRRVSHLGPFTAASHVTR